MSRERDFVNPLNTTAISLYLQLTNALDEVNSNGKPTALPAYCAAHTLGGFFIAKTFIANL